MFRRQTRTRTSSVPSALYYLRNNREPLTMNPEPKFPLSLICRLLTARWPSAYRS